MIGLFVCYRRPATVRPAPPICAKLKDSQQRDIVVVPAASTATCTDTPPTASFRFTTSALTASFFDISTDSNGTIATRSWSFGDGATSTLGNPRRTYAASGTYTVTDNNGASNSTSRAVTVAGGGGGGASFGQWRHRQWQR